MSTETNKAAVRRFHECFDKGDWAGMSAVVSPDVKSYNSGVEGVRNYSAFEAMGRGFMSAFSQSRNLIAQQVAEGEAVATRLDWTAIHSGNFNGIPASNWPVKMEVFVFDRIVGGKIVEHRAVFDVMGFLAKSARIPRRHEAESGRARRAAQALPRRGRGAVGACSALKLGAGIDRGQDLGATT